MREFRVVVIVLAIGFLSFSCASDGYNTQRGAAIGGAIGAIAGQAIGHNTAGTLIGLGAGALTGAIVGNAVDRDDMYRREGYYYQRRPQVVAIPREKYAQEGYPEPPPGRWVEVPGQWVGGRWVPAHKVWVPVNP